MARSCGIIEETKEKKDNSTNNIPSLHSHISPGKGLNIRRTIHLSILSIFYQLFIFFVHLFQFHIIRSIRIDEYLEIEELNFVHPVTLLHDGAIPYLRISFDGTISYQTTTTTTTTSSTTSPRKKGMLLLPGSFNPWHEGHWLLMKAAIEYHRKRSPPTTANNTNNENTTNTDSDDGFLPQFEDCAFELSAFNVDKPGLSVQTILERISQFAGTVTGNYIDILYKRFVLYNI